MNDLPKGWATTSLGELRLEKNGALDPLKAPNQKFELYSVPAFPSGQPEIIQGKAIGSTKQRVLPGTVLVCKINPRINRAWVVGNFSQHMKLASTEWVVFPPVDGIEPSYLAYFFRQDRFRDFLASNVSGVGGSLMRARLNALDSFVISVAPTKEQVRISEKLDELFSDLEAGSLALERARMNLQRYRAAVLKSATEGRLTEKWRAEHPEVEPASKLLDRILDERRNNWEEAQRTKYADQGRSPPEDWKQKYPAPEKVDLTRGSSLPDGWIWVTLDQLCMAERPIAYGVLQPGKHVKGGVPLVRVGDVNEGQVSIESLKTIEPRIAANFPRTKLVGGEVLLTIVGSIGRTAVVPHSLAGANTARAVAVIAIMKMLDPKFIEICLRERGMQARFNKAAHEVARKTLNLEDVRPALIPLPPLQEQAQIVSEVDRLLSLANMATTEAEHSFTRAATLRQAILKRAFDGKLVPQDPSDAPTSELLAAVKRQREGVDAVVAKRATKRAA